MTFILTLFILFPSIAEASDDITGHWAEDDLRVLIAEEIMEGSQGKYNPNEKISRAAFAALVKRALDLPEATNTKSPFSDVEPDDWFFDEVITANKYGIVNGTDKGTFKPEETINRQAMAEIIKNALDYKGIQTEAGTLSFNDSEEIDSWARPAVKHLLAFDIIKGKPGNTFAPLDDTTRAAAGTVIKRMLDTFENTEEDPPEEETDHQYNETLYDVDFSRFIEIQANVSPKVDGAGRFIASKELVEYYANSYNVAIDSPEYLQFLVLSESANLDAEEVNNSILNDKGILDAKGADFVQAGETYNINEAYLLAHALHETGNGTSPLSDGRIKVGEVAENKWAVNHPDGIFIATYVHDEENDRYYWDITQNDSFDMKKASTIKEIYNMFGIDAVDEYTDIRGAVHAYQEEWFEPKDAIIGGAKFVREYYIDRGQDTLYKMRWNPDEPGTHQYATHVSWAINQTDRIKEVYDKLNTYELVFDIPVFENQPDSSPKPTGDAQYAVNTSLEGAIGITNTNDLNFRDYPVVTSTNLIRKLAIGTEVEIIGENGGWYKVNVAGDQGWVSGNYVDLNVLTITNINTSLNVRNEPNMNSDVVGSLENNDVVASYLDENGNFIKEGNWYKIKFNGEEAWIHGDYVRE